MLVKESLRTFFEPSLEEQLSEDQKLCFIDSNGIL